MKTITPVAGSMKMDIGNAGFGMITACNEHILLVGGHRSGSSPSGQTRCGYDIYDWERAQALMDVGGLDQEAALDKTKVGKMDLLIVDGDNRFEVAALVNIEVAPSQRKKGLGKRVIQSIIDTTGKDLPIRDIKPGKVSAWKKMGVPTFLNEVEGSPINKTLTKLKGHKGLICGIVPKDVELNMEKKRSLDSALER